MNTINRHIILIVAFNIIVGSLLCQVGQISIPRIQMMPNIPTPYNLRDWKEVAIKYDSFVYDEHKVGQYLPLVSYSQNGINYPSQKRISLHSFVGTFSPQSSEGINVLQSLVGAALVGSDIRNLYSKDRLVMIQDFYNKNNGQLIYLNSSSSGSGNDWWYDMMPNIYFFQLYSLFPDFNAESTQQFITISERLSNAVMKMGGSESPWSAASMNYRAWDFKNMSPNENGVVEPEASGAFGWMLYHAYKVTNDKSFLKSAEWSMEFLDQLSTNPSYELMLPYGTYTAAKMNAELGTNYNVEKMVNWSFDRGPLRGWGTIVGKWKGFDVSGLVGEANDGGDDYAFFMNGIQQSAALVPMVRYDKRFARDIGKWMLNLSNASRLFYSGFLLAAQQDASEWTQLYDNESVIAQEAIKEKYQGIELFVTGDALRSGWAATNLALYGSSAVGYLGAIVSSTNVDKILQLNLNATDFYADESYPTYLYYNPFDTPKAALIDLGTNSFDLYESLSEEFIKKAVSGTTSIIIPPKEAVVIVVSPVDGEVTYDKNKMMIDGVVVDYNQTTKSYKSSPRIKGFGAIQYQVEIGESLTIHCTAEDLDSDILTYIWSSNNGEVNGANEQVIWTAPSTPGQAKIAIVVSDPESNMAVDSISITIVDEINKAPEIQSLVASELVVVPGTVVEIECIAIDQNDDALTFEWTIESGSFTGEGNAVQWQSPLTEGIFSISVKVTDEEGLSTVANISILVKNFEGDGQVIAWYPFNTNTNDISGNELDGTLRGAVFTSDKNGIPSNALYFNGNGQHIEVANDNILNFTEAITLSLWFQSPLSSDKEQFLVSHGSWQNRWKLSITPTKRIRWTINTSSKIADLDSDFALLPDQIYHAVATYDGKTVMLYLDGKLNSFGELTGNIKTTTYPLLIGQMLPDNSEYNFKGVVDDVILYNYALNPSEVSQLFADDVTFVKNISNIDQISIFPNPVNDILYLDLKGDSNAEKGIEITIIDLLGRIVMTKKTDMRSLIEIEMTSINQGIYYITVKGSKGQIKQGIKFIKT